MFHLAWGSGETIPDQFKNVEYALSTVRTAKECGCKRIIITGSQAEYGIKSPSQIEREDLPVDPITAYGAAKVATCYLTKIYAKALEIEWIWGRIFSLIGRYEPEGRMLPDLHRSLKNGDEMHLSSCNQNWDYLDVHDAAEALLALGGNGISGEIYNIANGDYRPLKEYTESLRTILCTDTMIHYGEDPKPFISLQPSVKKIKNDTGWYPQRSFEDSIRDYCITN